MRVAGLVVEGRSLAWPSPSSMSCYVRSARRARSAVRNSSPSEPMSRMNGIRSRSGGGWSPGASGCAVTSRQVLAVHQVRTSAEPNGLRRRMTKPPAKSSSRSSRNPAAIRHAAAWSPGLGDIGGLVPPILNVRVPGGQYFPGPHVGLSCDVAANPSQRAAFRRMERVHRRRLTQTPCPLGQG